MINTQVISWFSNHTPLTEFTMPFLSQTVQAGEDM